MRDKGEEVRNSSAVTPLPLVREAVVNSKSETSVECGRAGGDWEASEGAREVLLSQSCPLEASFPVSL